MRKRWRAKREEILKGTGYDSLLEKQLHETVLKDCRFHAKEDYVEYIVPHTYQPDFVFEKDGKTFYIETKGRFTEPSEASKYIHVRNTFDEKKQELVFVWDKSGTRFPYARKRKDGTYQSNEEWSDKNGFRHWDKTRFSLEML